MVVRFWPRATRWTRAAAGFAAGAAAADVAVRRGPLLGDAQALAGEDPVRIGQVVQIHQGGDADAMSLRESGQVVALLDDHDRIGGQGDGGQDRPDSQGGDEPDKRADQQGSLQEIVPPGWAANASRVPVQGRITTRADARSDRGRVKVPADRPGVLRYRVVESAEVPARKGPSCSSGILVISRNPCEIPSHTLGGSR